MAQKQHRRGYQPRVNEARLATELPGCTTPGCPWQFATGPPRPCPYCDPYNEADYDAAMFAYVQRVSTASGQRTVTQWPAAARQDYTPLVPASADTVCYQCGQAGHRQYDCPALNGR